jgi:hypothetical protein
MFARNLGLDDEQARHPRALELFSMLRTLRDEAEALGMQVAFHLGAGAIGDLNQPGRWVRIEETKPTIILRWTWSEFFPIELPRRDDDPFSRQDPVAIRYARVDPTAEFPTEPGSTTVTILQYLVENAVVSLTKKYGFGDGDLVMLTDGQLADVYRRVADALAPLDEALARSARTMADIRCSDTGVTLFAKRGGHDDGDREATSAPGPRQYVRT